MDSEMTPGLSASHTHYVTRDGAEKSTYLSSHGVYVVQGKIRDKWAATGWERGPMGLPVSDELDVGDGVGEYNHFNGSGGGSIYWTEETGAHEVYGEIRDRWEQLGWERSYLGYPLTGELDFPLGRTNEFEHGYIDWHRATGEVFDFPR